MRRSSLMILFLFFVSTGVTVPFLSLILLARGCNLSTLALAMGLYGAVVVVLELPSGMLADIKGRKMTFLLSCALYVVCVVLLLLSKSLALCVAAMMLQGVARALSSGSFDALIIDQALEQGGTDVLPKVTSAINICQCVGLALGALLGGLIPNIQDYALHLAVRGITIAIVAALTFFMVHEKPRPAGKPILLINHIKAGAHLLSERRALQALMGMVFLCSVSLFMVETYWQPTLATLGDNPHALYGMLGAGAFAFTAFGSALMSRVTLRGERAPWIAYFIALTGLGGALFALALQRSMLGFSIGYIAFYFVLGAVNIPEQTILHMATPDALRASMLSLYSLAFQFSGVAGGVLSTSLIGKIDIKGLFFLGAALIPAAMLLFGGAFIWVRKKDGTSATRLDEHKTNC